MLPSLRRYKSGFDRLGIVLFVLVAAGFAVFALLATEPYIPPAEDSEAGRALAAEASRRCEEEDSEPLVALCGEQVRGEHKFEHYKDRFALQGWGLLVAIPAALAGLAFLLWGVLWILAGFRHPERDAALRQPGLPGRKPPGEPRR